MNINEKYLKHIKAFEKKLGLDFIDKNLLFSALTHSSFSNYKVEKGKANNNERLEFFGDAVLKLVVSEYLYKKFFDMDEGQLTKIRAQIVSDRMLARFAKDINLGEYMFFSYGEKNTGGKQRKSNLANAIEAILGAIYLDRGIEETQNFFLRLFSGYEKEMILDGTDVNYKTTLQEILQQNKKALPVYTVLKEEGPEHAKCFSVEVEFIYKGRLIKAIGKNVTKKEAEQKAAEKALDLIRTNR